MSKRKRNITIAAVLLCIGAAVYLNWAYNNRSIYDASGTLTGIIAKEESPSPEPTKPVDTVSDYFAQARLTRQQARDEALQLLQVAATSQAASQETIDGAMSTIAAMANFSMQETQIENLLLAKNFAECVAFINSDGVTLAVPAPAGGLSPEEVARITDAVISETHFNATQIRIIEVRSGGIFGRDSNDTNPPSPTTDPNTQSEET